MALTTNAGSEVQQRREVEYMHFARSKRQCVLIHSVCCFQKMKPRSARACWNTPLPPPFVAPWRGALPTLWAVPSPKANSKQTSSDKKQGTLAEAQCLQPHMLASGSQTQHIDVCIRWLSAVVMQPHICMGLDHYSRQPSIPHRFNNTSHALGSAQQTGIWHRLHDVAPWSSIDV